MPLNQYLILKIPSSLLGVLIVGFAIVASAIGVLVVRHLVPHRLLKEHNDLAGAIFATLGVTYAVVLAFVVVIVWQQFDRASLNIEREVNVVADLYWDAKGLSPDFGAISRALLKDYVKAVIDDEWRVMARGGRSSRVQAVVEKMWALYADYSPRTKTEEIFFNESVRKLNELGELRRSRLMDASTGVHPLLWFVLIIGAAITIVFTFFFGAGDPKVQMVMVVFLATLLSLILFTILVLDFPFTGDMSILPREFERLLAAMQ